MSGQPGLDGRDGQNGPDGRLYGRPPKTILPPVLRYPVPLQPILPV